MIRTRREGDVTVIFLNRPDKRNALVPEMLDQLREAIEEAVRNGSRALVLAGEGRIFCGGFDLQLSFRDQGVLESLLRGLFETVSLLRSLPIPVIIAAHGGAIAGGCALIGGADVIIADRNAKLGYPVLPLGISPAVSAPFLRLTVGDGPCRARLLEPTLISAEEAQRLGLVHELVDAPEEVLPLASKIAASLAAKPAIAMQATREWLAEVEGMLADVPPQRGLNASLSLVGGDEERQRLAELFG